jgi:RNA polymerase sigma-70 factor (ECF subfamily)
VRSTFVNRACANVYKYVMRDPEEDGALVQAARDGDRHAFALLYHRYKLDAWNLAYLTLRSYHEAEDSLQETFVKAMVALSSGVEVEAVRPWLMAICRNVCLDRLRSARRRPAVSLDSEDVSEPVAAPVDQDGYLDFHRTLRALSRQDREAFLLVDVLGCRSHEAASILGLHASSTLRSRLARARTQIASAVTDDTRSRGAPPPEIWGVYHHPPDSAIVAAFAVVDGNGHARAALDELIARLETQANLSKVAHRGFGLSKFFERLERRIPTEQRVIAVIHDRAAGTGDKTRHWLADHPRWQVRRPANHASWLLEVQSLLSAAGTERACGHSGALAALNATTPFLWTQGR